MKLHEKELREVYCETLFELVDEGKDIWVVEADLAASNGTMAFAKRFPERFVNCGVAEANMVGISAGIANEGAIPFCSSFTPFATRRVYDQVFISVAYAGLNVKIVGTDPGVTAEYNGGTHMFFEDLALMRVIPNMTVIVPCDAWEVRGAVRSAAEYEGPVYIQMLRKPRPAIFDENYRFEIGKSARLTEGDDLTIITLGLMTPIVLEAARKLQKQNIHARVINMSTVKPLDREAIEKAAKETGAIMTVENQNIVGNLGSAVAEVLSEENLCPLKRMGINDAFGEVASIDYLLAKHGLTAEHIAMEAEGFFKKNSHIEKERKP